MSDRFQLRPFQEQDRANVLKLRVSAAQQPFVDPIPETLKLIKHARDNHVITSDGTPVGFFQIETENLRRFQDASAQELELHEFFIDIGAQGQGLGNFFISNLANYVRKHYPNWSTIALSVNCKNLTAFDLYQKGGFIDTAEIWRKGRSGPQHVMRMHLDKIFS